MRAVVIMCWRVCMGVLCHVQNGAVSSHSEWLPVEHHSLWQASLRVATGDSSELDEQVIRVVMKK